MSSLRSLTGPDPVGVSFTGGGFLRTLTSVSEIRALGWNSSLSLNWGPRHTKWP